MHFRLCVEQKNVFSTDGQIMINLKGVTCGYGTKIVLNHIDLEIGKSEFVGIIGPKYNCSEVYTSFDELVRAIFRANRKSAGALQAPRGAGAGSEQSCPGRVEASGRGFRRFSAP